MDFILECLALLAVVIVSILIVFAFGILFIAIASTWKYIRNYIREERKK